MSKPAIKHERILSAIRGDVVVGRLKPGARLPTREDLGREFGAGAATVQRALERLTAEGFLQGRPGAGTFVSEAPPHLSNVALVFPFSQRNMYYDAVRAAAKVIGGEEQLQFLDYYTDLRADDRHDSARLCEDARDHRFGGMIFVFPPVALRDTAAVTEPGISRVMLSSEESLRGIPALCPDYDAFLVRALEHLHAQGCRRIAHIAADPGFAPLDAMEKRLHDMGHDTPAYLIQPVGSGAGFRSASQQARLLMELAPDKRPDGLVIHDDHITDHAVAGLIAAEARVPRDLHIVAYANFPTAGRCALPVTRLGFDARAALRDALKVLDTQRSSRRSAPLSRIAPVFEHELPYQDTQTPA